MPTGGGKSLCYQLPATIGKGLGNNATGVTVVISPLLSLMHDQAMHLLDNGVPTIALRGNQDAMQRQFAFEQLYSENPLVKIVYLTPEMLFKSSQ
ncbi:ATP-dependent DNA helicase sgs1, partial [Mortierella alpina]